MKDKKDEKKMEEHIKRNVNAIKNSMKNYKKLITMSENYCKSQLQSINSTKQLSETLITQATSGITDLDQGMNSVVDIFNVIFAGRNETTRFFNEEIIPIMKKNCMNYPVMISNFEKRYEGDQKRAQITILNAEKKAKNSPNELKKTMEEIKQAESLKQQSIVQGLQDTTKMVRELYCGMIQLFVDLFEKEKNCLQQIVEVLKSNENELKKMAHSTSNYGEEVGELIKAKKQTLIDLKLLSPEFKEVLKAAGLKRKDLCNPEVVTLLIQTVEEAVKQGKCDQSVLDQLTKTEKESLIKTQKDEMINEELKGFLDDDDDIISPSLSKTNYSNNYSNTSNTSNDSNNNNNNYPQPPKTEENKTIQSTAFQSAPVKRAPPSTPQRRAPPSIPQRNQQQQSNNNNTISNNNNNNIPPPPSVPTGNLPPPPPPAGGIPPPPPSKGPVISHQKQENNNQNNQMKQNNVQRQSTHSFLDDINKGGHVLKKTEPLPEKKMTVTQQGDLTSMLANAMANRRKDIQDSSSEDESSDVWSD